MQAFILALHVIVCIVLIVIVLLQSGKEGMGVIFGGGSGSLFGGSGAGGLLAKVTAAMATVFIITSLSYTYMTREREVQSTSIMDQAVEQKLDESGEAAPAAETQEQEAQGIQVDTGEEAGSTGIQVETESEAAGAGDQSAAPSGETSDSAQQ